MIKMPIKLTTARSWLKMIAAACNFRSAIKDAASAETAGSGTLLRPLILFQTQGTSPTCPNWRTYHVIEN